MPEPVPGVILAGGLARRMGGGDKGLRELGGKSLMAYIVEGLSKQAAPLAINANGDASRFASFHLPVIPDRTPDAPGPLAGVFIGPTLGSRCVPQCALYCNCRVRYTFLPS